MDYAPAAANSYTAKAPSDIFNAPETMAEFYGTLRSCIPAVDRLPYGFTTDSLAEWSKALASDASP